MSRNLERSMARAMYAKFAKRWRQEQKLAGLEGKAGYKRPRFNEWLSMYQENLSRVQQSTQLTVPPSTAVPGPYYNDFDPWTEETPKVEKSDRGVTTIDIMGSEDE
jgi:hypothetical protein